MEKIVAKLVTVTILLFPLLCSCDSVENVNNQVEPGVNLNQKETTVQKKPEEKKEPVAKPLVIVRKVEKKQPTQEELKHKEMAQQSLLEGGVLKGRKISPELIKAEEERKKAIAERYKNSKKKMKKSNLPDDPNEPIPIDQLLATVGNLIPSQEDEDPDVLTKKDLFMIFMFCFGNLLFGLGMVATSTGCIGGHVGVTLMLFGFSMASLSFRHTYRISVKLARITYHKIRDLFKRPEKFEEGTEEETKPTTPYTNNANPATADRTIVNRKT